MLTIRTPKCNTIIKKPSSALFLWLHNSKGWFVGNSYLITLRLSCPSPSKFPDSYFLWSLLSASFSAVSSASAAFTFTSGSTPVPSQSVFE
jgi:hypothetical protein